MVRYRTVIKRKGGRVVSVKTYTQSKSGKWSPARATASPAGATATQQMRTGGGPSTTTPTAAPPPDPKPTPSTPKTAGEAIRMAREYKGTAAERTEYLRQISEKATREEARRRQATTQRVVTETKAKPRAMAVKKEPPKVSEVPTGYQFPTATAYTPLTKAELAEKQRMTYGVGVKGFLARGSERYRTDYPFDPKVPVSLAFGVGKIGYGAATFVKGVVTDPFGTIKQTATGAYRLVKDPTEAGYQFAEYARTKPFEAVGQVAGAVLISKGIKKGTGYVRTKAAQKFGAVELKPSKIAYKTRVVKTTKGTELKGTAILKGKAETYYPFKIKGKAKIVSRAKPKVYAMKRPGGTFSEAFGEPGKVKVFGQKTAKAFTRESDVALKFKIKGTPKEFVGKGKGMVGETRFAVKSAAPAYVRGARTTELYDIKTGKRYGKLLRGAQTRSKDIFSIETVGKRQTVIRGQRVARTDSVFKVRPTGKKEVVIAPKEVIYGREALKKGRYGIGGTKAYGQFTVKTPPIRTRRFKGAEVIYPTEGRETFAKGFGRATSETLARKGTVQQLAKAKLRGYLPKQVKIAGITGVGLEPPTTILVPPKTRPSASYLSGIGATAKDIAKGAVYLTPKVGIGGLGVIPALRQVPKTQPALKPIQRPSQIPRLRVRVRQRTEQKPRLREIIQPKIDTKVGLGQGAGQRQRQVVEQVVVPKVVPEQKLVPKTPRVPSLFVPEPIKGAGPFIPKRRARMVRPRRPAGLRFTQPKIYTPTLRAVTFGIKAKKAPLKLTGLEERGLLK